MDETRKGPAIQKHVEEHPLVTVIIPVYNDRGSLAKCLAALEAQTYPAAGYEVVVVDNGKNSGIERTVGAHGHARLEKEERPGAEAARNKGIETARGEVLAFTDADCVPSRAWLEKGVQALYTVSGCGLVAGDIVFTFKDGSNPNIVELYDSRVGFKIKEFIEEAHFPAGGNFFVFRSVLERAGRFNDKLMAYGDYELGKRIYGCGYKQVFSGEAFVEHPARASFADYLYRCMRLTGGYRALHPGTTLLHRVKMALRETFTHLNDRDIGGPLKRAKFAAFHALVKIAAAYELARLTLGGKARR